VRDAWARELYAATAASFYVAQNAMEKEQLPRTAPTAMEKVRRNVNHAAAQEKDDMPAASPTIL
jgi:hypothetical protein